MNTYTIANTIKATRVPTHFLTHLEKLEERILNMTWNL